jgi:hypothetical protein
MGCCKKLHPALKTIVPQVAVGIGIDYPAQNNIFMSYMLQWIQYVTNNKLTDEVDFANAVKWDSINTKWYKSGKSFRSLDTISGKPSKIFQDGWIIRDMIILAKDGSLQRRICQHQYSDFNNYRIL